MRGATFKKVTHAKHKPVSGIAMPDGLINHYYISLFATNAEIKQSNK